MVNSSAVTTTSTTKDTYTVNKVPDVVGDFLFSDISRKLFFAKINSQKKVSRLHTKKHAGMILA